MRGRPITPIVICETCGCAAWAHYRIRYDRPKPTDICSRATETEYSKSCGCTGWVSKPNPARAS